jgi:peptide/nickel transport system permease protein
MIRFILYRLRHTIFLLFGVSLLSFFLLSLAPGDYLSEMQLNPQISPETMSALRHQYDLDRPVPLRYAHWLGAAIRGDLGFSFAYNIPVTKLLGSRILNTLLLTVPATLLAWLIAIAVGVISAAKQGKWEDHATNVGATMLLITPDILIALALLCLALRSGYFPVGGMISIGFDELSTTQKIRDIVLHAAIPITILVLSIIPVLIRHVRATMVETLHSPFVRAARAHGIPQGRLLFRHVLPAAANPLISLFGLSIANLLGVSLITEVVMSWPGLGPLLLESVQARDLYVVIGAILVSSLVLQAGVFLSDLLLLAADPRIRTKGAP